MLDRSWIIEHIPHQGAMCLLEKVESWDLDHVRCRTARHRDSNNPMRTSGRLGAAGGIEFAAQAMALHGALMTTMQNAPTVSAPPKAGLLVSVRNVQFNVTRLDDIEDDLLVEATRVSGDGRNVIYDFKLCDVARLLITGRAAVILDAELIGK
ncbi:3-hydroxylacyl-ACP dehydratase [Candidatus Methylospira mobilis]|uniref:3-hydroxylacyl-ACP dehydratase n=1 Tax=Candidatus Methylospira mobilis TaxID=1808979 RepID=A0A5Q0BKT7_9GAMM|nr:3-hydroxylacyl-ACP dehydratase [Candidatus Methylospira mobilis]QFY44199.1 3-hydroxylacyl-ACP dehydratase [Candidatus Methylospira mobilis]WNV06375.1 hydroxymyristoyl-ACP dehydratase [Candidatus Methylospira mobilis]